MTITPGVSRGTRIMDCCRCRSADGSVLPITMKISACGFIAPVIHHLRPLMTYSSPSRSMRVAMLVASEEATSGSVIANADRISPSSSGCSQRFCCSGVPNVREHLHVAGVRRASSSARPGARSRLRPVISASGAYCRLVSPAPCSPGRNRFHSPRDRAWARSSPSTGTVLQAQRLSSAASCSANTGSAG